MSKKLIHFFDGLMHCDERWIQRVKRFCNTQGLQKVINAVPIVCLDCNQINRTEELMQWESCMYFTNLHLNDNYLHSILLWFLSQSQLRNLILFSWITSSVFSSLLLFNALSLLFYFFIIFIMCRMFSGERWELLYIDHRDTEA